jgi:hypothetical protein
MKGKVYERCMHGGKRIVGHIKSESYKMKKPYKKVLRKRKKKYR